MPNSVEDATLHVSHGATPSERYLSRLARESFLSLWSYSNVFTDEGRKRGKGDGKELCDLLVVFGRDILIFSDKFCEFSAGHDVKLSWSRWYRRAVDKSVRQILGARNWISRFPGRIFLDRECQRLFPLEIPAADQARFHLIAVTGGSHAACKNYFAGGGTGSLMIDTALVGLDHQAQPFTIGRIVPQGPYVHVLDEFTLDVVLREMDTIRDLVDYFVKKEIFLNHPQRKVVASGEEQLVAMYLTNLDDAGDHNFAAVPDDVDAVYIDEGHWEDFVRNPQYLAKKAADEKSYAWDRLIEHLVASGDVGLGEERRRDVTAMEPGLRVLASECRLARRQLAEQLLGALSKAVPSGQRFLRLGYSNEWPDTAYVFLILPRPPHITSYDEYRVARRAMLLACCKVARLRVTTALRIVGLATEPGGTRGASEDLVVLEVQGDAWGPAQLEEARQIQRDAGILLDENLHSYNSRESEYPDAPTVAVSKSPAARLRERQRIRNIERLARRQAKR